MDGDGCVASSINTVLNVQFDKTRTHKKDVLFKKNILCV